MTDERRKRKIRVLVGDFKDNIGIHLIEFMTGGIGDEYELKAMITPMVDELLGLAKNNEFDIFLIILNNIHGFSSKDLHGEPPVGDVMQLVTYLKTTYRRPVIAFSGLPDEPAFSEGRAKLAGADVYLPLPFKVEDFMEAIRTIVGPTP